MGQRCRIIGDGSAFCFKVVRKFRIMKEAFGLVCVIINNMAAVPVQVHCERHEIGKLYEIPVREN